MHSPWFPRVILGTVAALLAWAIVALSIGTGGPQRVTIGGSEEVQQLLGGVRQDGRRLGNPDSPVTVTVFNDLQCAPCASYETDTVDALVDSYARGDSVQFEFRHLSFGGAETTLAADAAAAASLQDRGWQYLDLFYRNQAQLATSRVTPGFLDEIAAALPEFDQAEWNGDLDTPASQAIVSEDAQVADSLHLPFNAPSVVVTNDSGFQKIMSDSPSLDEVQAAIADAS